MTVCGDLRALRNFNLDPRSGRIIHGDLKKNLLYNDDNILSADVRMEKAESKVSFLVRVDKRLALMAEPAFSEIAPRLEAELRLPKVGLLARRYHHPEDEI